MHAESRCLYAPRQNEPQFDDGTSSAGSRGDKSRLRQPAPKAGNASNNMTTRSSITSHAKEHLSLAGTSGVNEVHYGGHV